MTKPVVHRPLPAILHNSSIGLWEGSPGRMIRTPILTEFEASHFYLIQFTETSNRSSPKRYVDMPSNYPNSGFTASIRKVYSRMFNEILSRCFSPEPCFHEFLSKSPWIPHLHSQAPGSSPYKSKYTTTNHRSLQAPRDCISAMQATPAWLSGRAYH